MLNLSPHLTSEEQQKIGPLYMSHRAASQLRLLLRSHRAIDYCKTSHFAPIVAKSVAGFLTSDYFKLSAWFCHHPGHATCVCTIGSGEEQVQVIMHVTRRGSGYTVVAPEEHELGDDYFVRRLTEEVRVEYGIPEPTEPPRGRCA